MLTHHCDVKLSLLVLCISTQLLFSISPPVSVSVSLFVLNFLIRSFRECKGKNLFCFPKFYFFFFFGPPFSLFPLCFATLRFLSCGLQRWGFFQSLSSVIFTFF